MKNKQKSNLDDVVKAIEAIHPDITVPKEQGYIYTGPKINYLKPSQST